MMLRESPFIITICKIRSDPKHNASLHARALTLKVEATSSWSTAFDAIIVLVDVRTTSPDPNQRSFAVHATLKLILVVPSGGGDHCQVLSFLVRDFSLAV